MSWLKHWSLVLLAALAGCQDQPTPAPSAAPDVAPAKPAAAAANTDPSVTAVAASARPLPPTDPTPKQEPKKQIERPTTAIETPFEPPFGHRVELFVPPQQDTGLVERAPRSEESAPEVVLKGFVNVGAPKAVLLIDGAVSSLGQGQEKHGIRILSLDPPQVTLERGRRRWTLSLAKLETAASRAVRPRPTESDDSPADAAAPVEEDPEKPPTQVDEPAADE